MAKESAEVRNFRAMHVSLRPILAAIRAQRHILSASHGPIISKKIYRWVLIEIIEKCQLILDADET